MRILFLLCVLVSAVSLPALASTTRDLNLTPEQDWQAQREAYRQALELLTKGQRSEFDKAAFSRSPSSAHLAPLPNTTRPRKNCATIRFIPI